ncbi:hypothetical protein DNTS_000658 [Danionella cerebrum]|uniref:AAA+ ATPase domain-containing protein n=1 Tax=Danionella cerebrum TaxID=2873325 RepID=A0A553PZM1_9TELE|nr:hypothetical protein DNTS_000658 [Danionella translucida]
MFFDEFTASQLLDLSIQTSSRGNMAGVVAMAAVIEDFEDQPCKKLRKDGDIPSVRTITNYFMPKQAEKPFSPPRSNNIMDYFKKPAQEIKSCAPIATKPPEQVISEISRNLKRRQGQKRNRKIKDHKKSQKEDAEDVLLFDDTIETTAKECEDAAHGCLDEEDSSRKTTTEVDPKDLVLKSSVQSSEHNQKGGKDSVSELSGLKSNRKVKNNSEEDKEIDGDAKEASQELAGNDEKTAEPLNEGSASNTQNYASIGPVQVSPRTLTIQAEVHPISPEHHKSFKDSNELKVAAIFSKNKKSLSKDDKRLSNPLPAAKSDVLPDLKRKSNVVLLEEDLELDVVESSSCPKSTKEERMQFMNAFKQPSLEGFKSKTNKAQSKMNQVQDKVPEPDASGTGGTGKEHGESVHEKPEVKEALPQETKSRRNGKTKAGKKRQASEGEEGLVTKAADEPGKKSEEGTVRKAANQPKKKKDGKIIKSAEESEKKSDGKTRTVVKESEKSAKARKAAFEPGSSVEGDHSTLQLPEDPLAGMNVETHSVLVETEKPTRGLRRSTRELPQRQSAAVFSCTSQKNSSGKNDNETQKTFSSAKMSTPKAHRAIRGVYRAEMICPPDDEGSPIRMKIRRVFPSSAAKADDFQISSPLSMKEVNAVKKRKQAQKLVQKAKALQKSKKDTKEKESLRRSTRSKESAVNYCEDEDSVVFLEEAESSLATSQEINKKHKKLRSLNDVLASKLAPLFVEKKPKRSSVVISIFDDSSREASENSQDDEQFRAKREFLKSGLPESFRKHLAKTAANREAYTQACASFQAAVHIQQRAPGKCACVLEDNCDCSIWNLKWPTHPFLRCLNAFRSQPSAPSLCAKNYFVCSTVPAKRAINQKIFCRKSTFSEPTQQCLLNDLRVSNPSFPHQRFFTKFLKRHEDHILQASEAAESKVLCSSGGCDTVGRKRKRVDEAETQGKMGKKAKSVQNEDDVILIEDSQQSGDQSGRGRRGRSQRKKQKETAKLSSPGETENTDLIIVDPPAPGKTNRGDEVKEDMLWTDKYQPQHSSEVIGNMESVRRLHSWLKEWKLRADRDEKRKQQEKKQDEDSNDSWLISEGLDDTEDVLCNTLLITGPTGVGKTAAVYACAQELGFKVFEVNSSSQRSGRQILSQLKEATQSHQVDIQGVNAHKPAYFSCYSSSSGSFKPGTSPRKLNSPRRAISSPRKPPQSPRSTAVRKGRLAPTSLANFFKASGRTLGKDVNSQDKNPVTADLKKSTKAKLADSERKSLSTTPAGVKVSAEDQVKRTTTSLILFEEVDVIFDDDSGFLAAIKTFMTTTKRPVILTTSDSSFGDSFDGYFEEIHFKAPSVADVSTYLQLLCMAENMRTDTKDVSNLLEWNNCDIRQSLLQLQFWGCCGGGWQKQSLLASSDAKGKAKPKRDQHSVKIQDAGNDLPECQTVFTESLLGISNMKSENIADFLLRDESSSLECVKSWGLLSEVHRTGNLLYSNMECLLPLPTRLLPKSTQPLQPAPNPESHPEQIPQSIWVESLEEPSDDGSPLKISSRMTRRKKLAEKDVFHSESESEEVFLSLPKPIRDSTQSSDEKTNKSVSKDAPKKPTRIVLSEAERKKSRPVMRCLSSLADFMDHMSFMDSTLNHQPLQSEGSCRPQDIGWAAANVRSGMTDDVRMESVGQMNGVDVEVQAVLGHLSFRKCKTVVSEAWDQVQHLEEDLRRGAEEELTLPVAQYRNAFSFTQSALCNSRVVEKRNEAMKSVLSTRTSGMLGNREAVALDYMPSLRTICRSERLKEQGKIKRRFLHYLDGIHFTLPKSTVDLLASEFP